MVWASTGDLVCLQYCCAFSPVIRLQVVLSVPSYWENVSGFLNISLV